MKCGLLKCIGNMGELFRSKIYLIVTLISITSISVLAQTSTIVLSGIAGNSSQQMLNRIEADVLDHNPETTILLAGTNDMLNSGKNITITQFEANLREIVEQITEANSEIVIMTIPPCVEETLFERHDESYYEPEGPNGRVDLANDIIRDVATEFGLVLVDMNDLFVNNMTLLSNDGVHPSTAGYTTMSNLLYDALEDNCLPTGTVVCFGNSITRGYSSIFEEQLTNNPIDCEQGACSKITADIQINGEDFCKQVGVDVNAATDGGSYIGNVQTNDYLSYGLFDFDANAVNVIEASYGKSSTKDTDIEVRLDSPTGTLIGTVDASETTGGSQNWATNWAQLDAVSGEHEVFIVFKGDAGVTLVNFNWFKIFTTDICFFNASLKPNHIEAECFDDMEGIQTQASTEGTDNVGWIEDGDWMMYNDLDLTGMNSIKARVSGKTTGSVIEVRLGGIDGTLLGELTVTNTGGDQNWVTDSINITSTNGIHDIYLVFNGDAGYLFNINHFGFSEEQMVVTSLKEELNNDLQIYPNPTSNITLVRSKESIVGVTVSNTVGNVVLNENLGKEVVVELNLSGLPTGVYYLNVTFETGFSLARKVTKE